MPETSATDGFSPTDLILSPRLVLESTNHVITTSAIPTKKNGERPNKRVGILSIPKGPVYGLPM
jgi:hypothetical protein